MYYGIDNEQKLIYIIAVISSEFCTNNCIIVRGSVLFNPIFETDNLFHHFFHDEKVQYLCDEHNIKLAHLCKEANIPKSTLSELKQGRTKTLSTQTLSKIANYFNVSLDFFDIDGVDDTKDELFEKRKLLFDMSKKATKEQLDTFLIMLKAVIEDK